MVTVAKFNEKIVEIMQVVDTVKFSSERGWIMICFDWEQQDRRKSQFKWIPASTKFDWVREFTF